jgi:hypothetical protein
MREQVTEKQLCIKDDVSICIGHAKSLSKTYGWIARLHKGDFDKQTIYQGDCFRFTDAIFDKTTGFCYACGYTQERPGCYSGIVVIFDDELRQHQKRVVTIDGWPIVKFNRIGVVKGCVNVNGIVGLDDTINSIGNDVFVHFDKTLGVLSIQITPNKDDNHV